MSKNKHNKPREEEIAQETAAEPEAELNGADIPEENAEAEAPAQEEKPDPAQQELAEAKAKADEYLAMAQRIQADFENFRKRNESVRADAYADGRKDTAAAMLPVLDNLERAYDAAAGSEDKAMLEGLELVLKQMTDVYQKMNVTPIDRLGEKFDPNLENAVMQGSPEDGEAGTVCQVLQKGYRIGDKVLRHAMVKVVPE